MIGKGHQGALVTLDERKSKLRLAWPVDRKTAEAVTEAIVTLLDGFKDFVHTLTFDNGKEFARHETLAKELNCHTYFAKPYHSWERGQNENANGLLRQYFPKTIGLLEATQQQVLQAVHKLNSRPRKGLGFKTPYEVFRQFAGVDAEKSSLMHLSLEFTLFRCKTSASCCCTGVGKAKAINLENFKAPLECVVVLILDCGTDCRGEGLAHGFGA